MRSLIPPIRHHRAPLDIADHAMTGDEIPQRGVGIGPSPPHRRVNDRAGVGRADQQGIELLRGFRAVETGQTEDIDRDTRPRLPLVEFLSTSWKVRAEQCIAISVEPGAIRSHEHTSTYLAVHPARSR